MTGCFVIVCLFEYFADVSTFLQTVDSGTTVSKKKVLTFRHAFMYLQDYSEYVLYLKLMF